MTTSRRLSWLDRNQYRPGSTVRRPGRDRLTNLIWPKMARARFHGGIKGVGELQPDVHGWHGPVTNVVVEPLD